MPLAKFKIRLALPLCSLIIFMAVGTVLTFYSYHHWLIRNTIREELVESSQLLRQEIDQDAELLGSQLQFLLRDPKLQQLWLARDREGLLTYASTLYRSLKPENLVTHFYFYFC